MLHASPQCDLALLEASSAVSGMGHGVVYGGWQECIKRNSIAGMCVYIYIYNINICEIKGMCVCTHDSVKKVTLVLSHNNTSTPKCS